MERFGKRREKMTNRTLYMSIMAFAAAAAVNANSNAHAEEPGNADLMQLINEDLDEGYDAFTLALTEQTGRKINEQMAKIDNVFGPLVAPSPEATSTVLAETRNDTGSALTSVLMASAEYEIAKAVANIENPYNPHLPMPPVSYTFVSEDF